MSTERVALEASRAKPAAGLSRCADPPASQRVEATILVRRRNVPGAQQRIDEILRGEAPPVPREQAAEMLGADPADVAKVEAFAARYGLTVTESTPAMRSVKVSGTVAQMEAAFESKLHCCEIAGKPHLCYEGALTIPAELDQVITGVLGLDQRPVARGK